MNVIWLDVTTTLNWHRPAVGIVRTEVECAEYALSATVENHEYKFCSFSAAEGYVEVTRDQLKTKLASIRLGHSVIPAASSDANAPKQPLEERLKHITVRFISHLPSRIRTRLFGFMQRRRPAVSLAIGGMRAFRASLKKFIRPDPTSLLVVPADYGQELSLHKTPFCPADTYISLGLDWDQKDLAFLYQVKRSIGLKVLLFCYDVIPVKLPHLCVGDVAARFADYFSKVAWCADKIVCISECSKTDLHQLLVELGAPIPSLEVVKLGCQISDTTLPPDPAFNHILNEPFILFVSTIERRKNHEILYRAYTRLVDKGMHNLPRLIFVGMQGWGVNDLFSDIALDPRTRGKIFVFNNVSDSDLLHLYRSCTATAFPSLYEGWGLPVAESLALGKYCLASSSASIPEVGGNLLEYLDPWDVQAWANAIEALVNDPDERTRKTDRIVREYKPISWGQTATSVYRAAVSISNSQR